MTYLEYPKYLLSPVINITATFQSTPQTQFEKPVRLLFNLLSLNMLQVDVNNVCLGYIDVMDNQWKCIDGAVNSIVNGQVTTFTNHFTSFALLTKYSDDSSSSQVGTPRIFSTSNLPLMYGLIFGFVGLVLMVVVIGTLLHFRSKYGSVKRWLVASRLSQGNLRSSKGSSSESSSPLSASQNPLILAGV
ncbi:hypothetical protein SAMD00019534_075580 [Acytostelium subglobosum LB1]|uniref:hypothetical protein n=1 Tax=Acytostelium subglobosum LB1 TaxID=1410327 RepID=UPI000644F58F|nr:hypothetical protein SAMD00019534_075580 [Acytostelium subglobosum LB1]GAM24383.1 hypothetical protein SAMD00019534_075580 [Acytostelium subglobosum LB1]|eukprot:XP_012752709.1 hypothetical protein SAMD00019534_075580 [Acytostelium subglobosum LB1]